VGNIKKIVEERQVVHFGTQVCGTRQCRRSGWEGGQTGLIAAARTVGDNVFHCLKKNGKGSYENTVLFQTP
jgi:hypothetical protein